MQAAVRAEEQLLQQVSTKDPTQQHSPSLKTILEAADGHAAGRASKQWKALLATLLTTFHDGYMVEDMYGKSMANLAPVANPTKLFYPKPWLEVSLPIIFLGLFNVCLL